MKIEGLNGLSPFHAYRIQQNRVRERAPAAGPEAAGDRVELSPLSQELQFYRKKLGAMPEVREELVAALRQRVATGEYRPAAREIVAGLMAEARGEGVRPR
ncbi:MAG: flagellar biosynthesis anti-sigma factor FlgM [Desulfotomaculales bacterium]